MVDMRTREGRQLREQELREHSKHAETWKPANMLPDPPPREGIAYRWIRVTVNGTPDVTNVSTRFREGWAPVPRAEVDAMALGLMPDNKSRFPDGLEVGGLLLCQISEERITARKRYYENMTRNQLRAADANWMRQSDPRMPVSPAQRDTRFGNGVPPR